MRGGLRPRARRPVGRRAIAAPSTRRSRSAVRRISTLTATTPANILAWSVISRECSMQCPSPRSETRISPTIATSGACHAASGRPAEREALIAAGGVVGADHCAMDRGQTSRTIDTLMQAGLVRLRPDVRDGRVTWFSLSPEGERRHEAGLPIAFQRQERLLQDFTPEERELFSRMLDRMIGRFAGKRP